MNSVFDQAVSKWDYLLCHTRLFTPVRYLFWRKELRPVAEKTIEEFHKPYSEALCRDMMWKYCQHLITMPQYFLYECDRRSYREIEQFLGNREIPYYAMKFNDSQKLHIFTNKYETYCTYQKYYGREIIQVTVKEDLSEFVHFALLHNRLIIKPIDGSSGHGVKFTCVDSERKAIALFNLLLNSYRNGFVAEEQVIQCEKLAAFHPESVNTVRMATIRHDDHVRIWHPFFRIGRGNSVVDNAGSGGIEVIIDPKTGVLGNADDMTGNLYEIHPDTGKQIKGYKLPRWKEAIALAEELSQVVPEMRYIGWDLALTDQGWIVIEGNGWARMAQNIDKVGWKAEFKRELSEIRHHK